MVCYFIKKNLFGKLKKEKKKKKKMSETERSQKEDVPIRQEAETTGMKSEQIWAKSREGKNFVHCKTAIIGAGWSGITAAINFLQNGYDDFLIFEAQDRIGGRCCTIDHGKFIFSHLELNF